MDDKAPQVDLLFTQKNGFEDYTPPERLRPQPKEDWDAYVARTRLEDRNGFDYSHYRGLSDRCFFKGEHTPGSYELLEVPMRNEGDPLFRLEVNGFGPGYDDYAIVWVKTRGDLAALRIQLAQLMQAETLGAVADLRLIVKRMFTAIHRHEPDKICIECDPEEYQFQQRDEEEYRKRQAEKRVFFLLDHKKGQVIIDLASTQAEMEAAIKIILMKNSQFSLVLSQRGIDVNYTKLLTRFAKFLLKKPRLFAASPEIMEYVNTQRSVKGENAISLEPPSEAN